MIFRSLDANGDWQWGKGINSYSENDRAINLNIRTALLLFLGEAFWSLSSGVDWLNLIGGKNPAAETGIILQTRTAIINAQGVVRINSVDASVNSRTRALILSYNIDTIFTRGIRSSVTVDI